jgi:pimeloyl-ACP methyl ester carboxylesterase
MGGLIAAHYADRHPDRVRGLVLAGPAGVKAEDPARIAAFKRRSLRHRFFWAVATVLWNAGATPQAFARALPFRWSPSAVRGYATRRWRALEFLDGDADAFDALVEYAAGVIMMRGVSERSMSLLLKPLGQARTEIGPVVERTPADLPVTFLYGAHDWMSPASGAEVVERMRANGRANVRCAILDDAGHYAFVDQPEKSHEVIEHALRKARWR